MQKHLHRSVFLTFLRMSTHKESKVSLRSCDQCPLDTQHLCARLYPWERRLWRFRCPLCLPSLFLPFGEKSVSLTSLVLCPLACPINTSYSISVNSLFPSTLLFSGFIFSEFPQDPHFSEFFYLRIFAESVCSEAVLISTLQRFQHMMGQSSAWDRLQVLRTHVHIGIVSHVHC